MDSHYHHSFFVADFVSGILDLVFGLLAVIFGELADGFGAASHTLY